MSYWQLRVRIYHESLKQWLNSLRQIGIGLVALFPMALPALVLIPLLSLGIIANHETTTAIFLNTLWGYLLLLYTWMSFQREGIYGVHYKPYLNSLPTNRLIKSLSDLGLTIYGANFFILGPLVLLVTVLFQQNEKLLAGNSELLYQLIPLLGLVSLAVYYSLITIKNRAPWLSLLLFPFIAFLWPETFTKLQWLLTWALVIFLERFLPDLSIKLGNSPDGFYRLLLKADISSPGGEKLRLIGLLLLIALTRVSVDAVGQEIQFYILNLVSFLSALLLASAMFGVQAYRENYQLYLASLPKTRSRQLVQAVIYVLLKTLIGVSLLALASIFDAKQWAMWLLFYSSTIVGILWRPKWFLFFPCILAVAIFLVSL